MSAEAVCQRCGSGYAGGRCLVCAQKYSAGYYHSHRKQVGLKATIKRRQVAKVGQGIQLRAQGVLECFACGETLEGDVVQGWNATLAQKQARELLHAKAVARLWLHVGGRFWMCAACDCGVGRPNLGGGK